MSESSALAALVEQARTFCQRLERVRGRDRLTLIRELLADLGALYGCGVRLPVPHYQDEQEATIASVQFLLQDVRRTIRKIQDSVEPDEALTIGARLQPEEPDDVRGLDAWKALGTALRELWGERDRVWYVHGPADPDDRTGVEASLADLLADIYVDMARIVTSTCSESERARAARLAFDRHWGAKAGLLLFLLHEALDRMVAETHPGAPSSSID